VLTQVNERVVIQFLEQHLITRFGFPSVIVFENSLYFSSLLLYKLDLDKGIILTYLSHYYPQGDVVAESTNKNMIPIHKKIVARNH
jgi:hypothetical protein